jgi:hypothetical protein
MSNAQPSLAALRVKAFVAACLVCLPLNPAKAADWRLSAIRQTHYGRSLAFLDVSSIQGGGSQVSFVASTYFSRRTGRMNRVSTRVTANCAAMTYRFEELVSFYNQRMLHRWVRLPTATAMPGTNVFDEISSACGIRTLGNHVDNPEAFAARYVGAQRKEGS